MSRKSGWRGFAAAAALLLCMDAGAADKRVALDSGETVVISWRDGWVVGQRPLESVPGTFVFQEADASKWHVVISPLPQHPGMAADTGNLRIYLRTMAREAEDSGVQVDPEHQSLESPGVRGFYVKIHDPKKKPGEYTDGYIGALAIGSRPYLFEVLWNTGGEAGANAAFAALKTVRIQ